MPDEKLHYYPCLTDQTHWLAFKAGAELATPYITVAEIYAAFPEWATATGIEIAAGTLPHQYTSTACQHGKHSACRRTCKFCEMDCLCTCHPPAGS